MNAEETVNLAAEVHECLDGSMERLVRAYQDRLFAYALRMLRDSFDAQEVVQDAFVRAHKALVLQYDTERCRKLELRPWLFRITRNLAYNRLRARRAKPEEPFRGGEEAIIAAPGRGRQRDSAEELDFDVLERALAGLRPGVRELVVLRFIEELRYSEIAGVLGTGEASVRGKVFRALKSMKRLLLRERAALLPGPNHANRSGRGLKRRRGATSEEDIAGDSLIDQEARKCDASR